MQPKKYDWILGFFGLTQNTKRKKKIKKLLLKISYHVSILAFY